MLLVKLFVEQRFADFLGWVCLVATAAGFVLIILWRTRAALARALRWMPHLPRTLVGSFCKPQVLTHIPSVGCTILDWVLGW